MLKTIISPLLDFLFPASDAVGLLETNPDDLLQKLPQAELSENFECIFAYQHNEVKELVWEIKYYKNEKVSEHVGKLLAQKIQTKTKPDESYILVPIPQTAKRLNERGFNHTELITHSILKHLPSNFSVSSSILKKIRHTPKQNSIEHKQDRFKNIEGAFAVTDPHLVNGKNIIIIDDVITTGATVGEARKPITKAGAKEILILAIAH